MTTAGRQLYHLLDCTVAIHSALVQVCGLDVIMFIVSATAKGGFQLKPLKPPGSTTLDFHFTACHLL